jgi:hypothetical protein
VFEPTTIYHKMASLHHVIITPFSEYFISNSRQPGESKMIPITPTSFQQRRRAHWVPVHMPATVPAHIPATVCVRDDNSKRFGLDPSSADELMAATALINLSPQEPPPRHFREPRHVREPPPRYFRPVEQPSPSSSFPSSDAFNQRWTSYSSINSSTSFESGRVSDEYSSEASKIGESFKRESPPLTAPPSLQTWYNGSVSLSNPEDDDVLSPLHSFMRRYCVEGFSATPEDISTPRYGKSHGIRVVVGQVGIRCLYCKHRPINQRPERAVCYPSSLRNIYHSIETWQRRHSLLCTDISPWVKKSMAELMQSSKSRAGGRRQYWQDSAIQLGMVDTAQGVRFSRPPGHFASPQRYRMVELPAAPVVREQDRPMVTDYLFLLMHQMRTCQFTEEDRTGGRSKIKDYEVGFPGMHCTHCRGKAGFGSYFPSSVHALALANSDRNIFNHLQKCRRCPNHIKAELVRLSEQQSHIKNKRGWRKLFFRKIWARIHGENKKEANNI